MMTDLNSLSDRELRAKLQQYGIDTTITAATRSLFIRQLKAATEESSNGIWHDEPVDNHPSSMRRRSAVKSELQFSEQHSLTMGHCTPLDSKSKLNTSHASNIFIPSPSVVVNCFVEGQESSPYDTGSDSEADKKTTKSPGVQKGNWAIPSWLSKKVHPTVQSVPVKIVSLSQSLKRKLNIMWQWQFIAAVLPLLAALFFLIVGAVYLRATYNDQRDSNDRAVQPTFLDPISEQAITDRHIELWCSIKSFLWNLVMFVVFAFVAFGVGIMCEYYVVSTHHKRESEKEEVLLMVKKIIVRLAQHHASKMADRRPQDAFMAIEHVRDSIIPLEDRDSKSKLWKKAVQYIEDKESRIRAEMQQIEGEDHRVWRWLAPSMTHGNQGLVSRASVDHSVDETCPVVWSVGPALGGKYPAALSVYPMT